LLLCARRSCTRRSFSDRWRAAESSVLDARLAIVAPLAQALVVVWITEQQRVAAVRLYVIGHHGQTQAAQPLAPHAIRVSVEPPA
jgi:hypothetical protein